MSTAMIGPGFGWLTANLGLFDPEGGRVPTEKTAFPEGPLLELVLLCRCLRRWKRLPAELAVDVERCLDLAEEVFWRPACHNKLFRAPALFTYYTELAVLLRDCGRLGGSIDGVIQWLIDNEHGDLHNPSRAPNARLELRYVLDLGGFRHRLPAVGELYRRTILDSPLDFIYLSDLEAYAITHIVFYLTDFGGRPASLTDEQMERAKETVEQLTALYLADGNWDLTAELLSCRRMLDLPPSDLTAFGWRCLAEAQASSGMIPGPHYGPGVAESMPDAVRKGIYEFRSSYHTTLVTMLAAVTWAVCDES